MNCLTRAVKIFDSLRSVGRPTALALAIAFAATGVSAGPAAWFAKPPLCRALFDRDVFSRFGAAPSSPSPLPSKFRVLVWNVFKGEKRGLADDFRNLARDSHLALLQEAVDRPRFKRVLSTAYGKFVWTMARSFLRSDSASFTGVATGSAVTALKEERLLSPVTEPFSHTPKTALVSDFKIQSRDGREHVLRVINVHAINFVSTSDFRAHMRQVFEAIEEHRGPLILAGDFNTWISGRTKFLRTVEDRYGLQLAHSAPGALLTLDYVFTRGLKTAAIHELAAIHSSDHQPMLVDFELDEDFLNKNT